MADYTEPTGGSQPFCAISPSDLVAINENWLSRIEALEKAVSTLLAVNVSAGQLSDISQQIGVVENVTYMGVAGWTQTEAGTLIPPAGWSLTTSGFLMSDGNVYQGVSVDSDGVIQFGFTQNGTIAGTMPDLWGGFSNVAVYFTDVIYASAVGNFSATGTWKTSETIDPSGLVNVYSSQLLKVAQSGWYMITLGASMTAVWGGDAASMFTQVSFASNTAPWTNTAFPYGRGVVVSTAVSANFSYGFNSTRVCYIDSAATISISSGGSGPATRFGVNEAMVTFQLLKAE